MESGMMSLIVGMSPQPSCYYLTGLVVCLFSNAWLRYCFVFGVPAFPGRFREGP